MTQGLLPFHDECEPGEPGLTGFAGLPLYWEQWRAAGLDASVARHGWVSGRQGWSDAPVVSALAALNLIGGDGLDDLLDMAGTAATLAKGTRVTDFIGLGVIAKTFPAAKVHASLAAHGKASIRQRDLPAHVMVYYVVALALFMNVSCGEVLRCLLESIRWLRGPAEAIEIAGKSGISQARTRLGFEVVRHLHDDIVKPIATGATKGAWYRRWRPVGIDGSTLDVADEPANVAAFGRPGSDRGESAFPKLRFVSLVENGTHVLFASRMDAYDTSEIALAKQVVGALAPGMLCLAGRDFFGYAMGALAISTGADQLWRVKSNTRLPCDKRWPDGSCLSHVTVHLPGM